MFFDIPLLANTDGAKMFLESTFLYEFHVFPYYFLPNTLLVG